MNAIQIIDASSVLFKSSLTIKSAVGRYQGFSNQSPGFPVMVNGCKVQTIEHLFHALKYPDSAIQKEILLRKTPSTCKRSSVDKSIKVREDWEKIRVDVLRYCLRLKLVWNSYKFGSLLKSVEGFDIVCEDDPEMGSLLMELRDEYLQDNHTLQCVVPPEVGLVFLGEPLKVIDRSKVFKSHDYKSPYEGIFLSPRG
jgi:predicted NAD-dependent protein-ADP-ribosyltransferase YbiA (DUF1768 family)